MKDKKIAICYDWIDKWGGVERLLMTLSKMYPDATFYTSVYDEKKALWANSLRIKTSFLQRFPAFIKNNRVLSLLFYPIAFESFDFKKYDVVISVSSSFAKSVITLSPTKHVNICLTPMRFLWLFPQNYSSKSLRFFAKPFITHLKKWDMIAAQRPDSMLSISKTVHERVKNIYDRDSTVIYPPFDTEYWKKINLELKTRNLIAALDTKYKILSTKYFLVVSRLEPYKRVDLVLETFMQLSKQNLVVVGDGSLLKAYQKHASSNIQFVPYVTDAELGFLYQNAQALIMPQEEDFGFVSLEAQFFGCPIVAFKKGGNLETVLENKTGIFFEVQSIYSLKNALDQYVKIEKKLHDTTRKYGPYHTNSFDKSIFIKQLSEIINKILST